MMTKHLKMIQVGKSPSRVVTQLKHYAFVYQSVDATISRWFSLFRSNPPIIHTRIVWAPYLPTGKQQFAYYFFSVRGINVNINIIVIITVSVGTW